MNKNYLSFLKNILDYEKSNKQTSSRLQTIDTQTFEYKYIKKGSILIKLHRNQVGMNFRYFYIDDMNYALRWFSPNKKYESSCVKLSDIVSVKKANILSYTDSKVSVFSSALVSIRSTLTNRECILTPLIDKLTNYVVYRQELGSSPLTPASDFVQVSPLIERSTCTSDGYKFSNNLVSYTTDETLRIVKFIDRYPNEVSKRYRYLFLFFDADGEPQSYSLTNPNIIEIQ